MSGSVSAGEQMCIGTGIFKYRETFESIWWLNLSRCRQYP